MSRQAREMSISGIFHIMLRGINKQIIFEEDNDRKKFLDILLRYKSISKYDVYGFCLMNNHIHLLLKENEESISIAVKRICSSYVRWYNEKYERCGHLFQERFKSEVVENDSYLMTVLRYIHQNPIKAGLSNKVSDYKWSSYNEYIGRSIVSDTDYLLQYISNSRDVAVGLFVDFSNGQNDDKCMDYIDKSKLLDSDVIIKLPEFGIEHLSELQQLDKVKRNHIIRGLKRIEGVSLRQLSRVTGLSKSVINKL